MEMGILPVCFIVAAIVLVLTKSKILGGKRQFVKERYISANNQGEVGWVHRWWHALWTCSMCCGFWVALVICYLFPVYNYFADVLICFGANWILHCIENILFFSGEILERTDKGLSEADCRKMSRKVTDLWAKIDKKFLK